MLVFDRFEMLDAVGPLEAFASAADILGGGYTIEIVSAGGGPIRSSSGLTVETIALDAATRPADTVLVAGGAGVVAATADEHLVDRVRRELTTARRGGSVCTGALLVAKTGLLDGRRAVTHWRWCDRLAADHPAITVARDPIFLREGNLWTSAGVTAGIDLALAMIEEDHGADPALAVARELVVFLKRPGGQAQFSVELRAEATRSEPIRRIQAWIAAHPEKPATVEVLAARCAMSPRNFSRVFVAETGCTPGRFVEEVRVARAARLLEGTDLPIEEIAHRAGFGSDDVLRRVFLRTKGVGPTAYRERFATHRSTDTTD
jgi:transcriptional regulator GlxA family with amidase domain